MPASIEDVARRAKVSISTVSRVLNGRNVVQQSTRERVEQAIEELGYRPNVFARGLMLRRSNILGLVLPDLHGEFYSEIIRGANIKARENGYHMLLSSVTAEDDGRDFMAIVGSQGIVDGLVVMVSELNSRIQSSLAELNVPLVVLDAIISGAEHDSVVIDQRGGAMAIMRHLVEAHPHRRIVFIGGHATNLDTIDRLEAYCDVLDTVGRKALDDDRYFLDYSYEAAYKLAAEHARRWADDNVCVFCANDEMAAGVLDAAHALNLALPDALAVVGFDGTRIASLTWPRLTTVRVPMAAMGSAAIDLLSKRLAEPTRPTQTITLHAEVVIRESCGCGDAAANHQKSVSGRCGGD